MVRREKSRISRFVKSKSKNDRFRKINRKKRKVVPKDIRFVDGNNDKKGKYNILHEDLDKIKGKQPLITYPIEKITQNEKRTFRLNDEGKEIPVKKVKVNENTDLHIHTIVHDTQFVENWKEQISKNEFQDQNYNKNIKHNNYNFNLNINSLNKRADIETETNYQKDINNSLGNNNRQNYFKEEIGNLFNVGKLWTLGHCISQDKFMRKGIAFSFTQRYPRLRRILKNLEIGTHRL